MGKRRGDQLSKEFANSDLSSNQQSKLDAKTHETQKRPFSREF